MKRAIFFLIFFLSMSLRVSAQLPSYYDRAGLHRIYRTINSASNKDNGVSFAFITDFHCLDNSFNSKYLLKEVLDSTVVPFVMCGGDFPSAYGSRDDVLAAGEKAFEYQDYLGNDRFFTIRGNHDFTVREGPGKPGGWTAQHDLTYEFICESEEQHVPDINRDHLCFYYDVPEMKTRFICMNSCDGQTPDESKYWGVSYKVTQEQLDWILGKALDIEGYHIVFISHIPADPQLPSYHKSQDAVHAIALALANRTKLDFSDGDVSVKADFTGTTDDVVCHISGHCHMDSSHQEGKLLSITTTCDAHYQDDGAHCKVGTMSEQAFDVYCIDYDTRTIRTVRVGRGTSRSWNF